MTDQRKTLAELLSATPEVVAVSENGIHTVKQTPTPKKEWVGLTDEEINNSYMFWIVDQQDIIGFGKSIETKLRRKNP